MLRTVDDLHCQEFNWIASFKILAYIIFISVFLLNIFTEYLLCVRHYA